MNAIKHIELTESQAQILLSHAYAEQERLIAQAEEIQSKVAANKALIDLLEGSSTNGVSNSIAPDVDNGNGQTYVPAEYNTGWSLSKKIDFVIRKSDKSLLAGQIVDGIVENDPSTYPDDESKRKLSVGVYASLNGKYKSGFLARKETIKGFRYQIKQ